MFSKDVIAPVATLLGAPEMTSSVSLSSGGSAGRPLDLKGLGKEIWEGEDAQEYIDRLRDGRDR